MESIRFTDNRGTFQLEQPENYNYLYFPVAGEQGIKSAVTPNLGGDSKLNQNEFIMEPVSAENLHNNRSVRNFWCHIPNEGSWSVVGASAEEESKRFTEKQDESKLTAGFMWHTVERKSKQYELESKITSFVPVNENVEIMHVVIKNTGNKEKEIIPIAAVPIYGRSADNIRDHRHVTSLLHRIETKKHGILVKPTLSFDERGHQINKKTYFVCGVDGNGVSPNSFYPIVEKFIGEGGTLTHPVAVLQNLEGEPKDQKYEGKEALGGLKFDKVVLKGGESISYTVLLGCTSKPERISCTVEKFNTEEKVEAEISKVQEYWKKQVNVSFHTGDDNFDNFMQWVSFQPILRRIYGCSFLPYHDYGKGGRGWRDLWQDCLALLVMNPDVVRQMILDNYRGVRIDGTNATIIGEKRGEFVADRNNITRVWMDHGVWPFLTTKLYMDQTGDISILKEQLPYYKDHQVERGTGTDQKWKIQQGNIQRTVKRAEYEGSVLEHLLVQNLCAFYEVGEHNHMRLRGADWNDALDMAEEKGESVAFTCAYAGNLRELAHYIREFGKKEKCESVELLEEIRMLLLDSEEVYNSVEQKNKLLQNYTILCRHNISGKKIEINISELAENLEKKADWIMEHIRQSEWISDEDGNHWFNSYYDNQGNAVEGVFEESVRMMLTGQVFAIMSGTAVENQIAAICKSADQYLFDQKAGGYRLNTNFHEKKYDLGRMFGFAYGEKENGAVFSHMTVMYANALYQKGFVKEGYKAIQTLADTAMNFETSKIYPGIPEYFNPEGRGMYHYLTGAASWYMLTMITEVFGVKGVIGDLCLEPKLVKQQFSAEGKASIHITFDGQEFHITYENKELLDYGMYEIGEVICDGKECKGNFKEKAMIRKEEIDQMDQKMHEVFVTLRKKEN